MITSLAFIIFFSLLTTVDRMLSVIPYVSDGGRYLNNLFSLVDNVVYMVRSVFPETLTMIFGVIAVFFGVLFFFMFFRGLKSIVPFLSGFSLFGRSDTGALVLRLGARRGSSARLSFRDRKHNSFMSKQGALRDKYNKK